MAVSAAARSSPRASNPRTAATCQDAPFIPLLARASMMPRYRSRTGAGTPADSSPWWAIGSSRRRTSSSTPVSPRPGQ